MGFAVRRDGGVLSCATIAGKPYGPHEAAPPAKEELRTYEGNREEARRRRHQARLRGHGHRGEQRAEGGRRGLRAVHGRAPHAGQVHRGARERAAGHRRLRQDRRAQRHRGARAPGARPPQPRAGVPAQGHAHGEVRARQEVHVHPERYREAHLRADQLRAGGDHRAPLHLRRDPYQPAAGGDRQELRHLRGGRREAA